MQAMTDLEVTESIAVSRAGDQESTTRVWERVYGELRAIAQRELRREQPGHTLSTTGLVHEAYFKLVGETRLAREDRTHFLALACRAMRQILIDQARRRSAKKREGAKHAVPIDEAGPVGESQPRDLVALDEALTRLSEMNERLALVVELRFFGGLTIAEAAEVLNVTTRTIERDWNRARAYLYRMLAIS